LCHLINYLKLPTSCLSIFSREHFLSSPPPKASPSTSIYLLPLRHGLFVSHDLCRCQHLRPPPQHLRLASTSLHATTSGPSSVSRHLRWHQQWRTWSRLQPWSRLASTPPSWCVCRHLCYVWFFPFFSFIVLLESGFKSLFFFKFDYFWDLLWLFNESICSLFFPWTVIFPRVEPVMCEKINFLMVKYLLCLRKSFF